MMLQGCRGGISKTGGSYQSFDGMTDESGRNELGGKVETSIVKIHILSVRLPRRSGWFMTMGKKRSLTKNILNSKQHHSNVLLYNFPMNGHT